MPVTPTVKILVTINCIDCDESDEYEREREREREIARARCVVGSIEMDSTISMFCKWFCLKCKRN